MTTSFTAIVDCKEGDILADSVFNKLGAAIVSENTVLNEYIINKLVEMGVQQVKTYNEYTEAYCWNESHIYRQIKESYKESILDIKYIVNELAAGKPLNVEKINNISSAMYCGIHDSCQVLRALNEEKELDEYTYTHSLNVALYAMLIGKWLRLDEDSIKNIIRAGVLHDIGKIKVPVEILNKKARLSNEEFEVIKKHPLHGYDLAKSTGCLPEEVCEAILSHHEREDKSGYPYGIGSEKINIYTKIITVADVYDAMTSDRIYKKRATPFNVFEMFQTTGVKNFDPKIVKAFLNNLSACYVGSKVMLNTGEVGEVVYIPPHNITEPIINIGFKYIDMSRYGEKNILCMV